MSDLLVTSGYGHNTREPFVMIEGDHIDSPIQMSPDEARAFAQNLLQAAEGAETDAFIFEFSNNFLEQPETISASDNSELRVFVDGAEVGRWVAGTRNAIMKMPDQRPAPPPHESTISIPRSEMKTIKPSLVLAMISWISVFILGWLIVFDIPPVASAPKFIFLAMLITAVMASAIYSSKVRVTTGDIRVRIGGEIFTGDALTIHELKDGGTFIYVDLSKPNQPSGTGQDKKKK